MKILTLTEPWATLVKIGAKRIETRSWWTKYRGPLGIHAAMGYPEYAMDFYRQYVLGKIPEAEDIKRGHILATCRLIDCVRAERVPYRGSFICDEGGHTVIEIGAREHDFGDFSRGRWAWVLADVKPLETPIPAKGKLGLWEYDMEETVR